MAINIVNTEPIVLKSNDNESLLSDLQGNILRSHGRENVILLIIKFTCAEQDARNWVRAFSGWVTSALKQSEQARDWLSRAEESLFANLFVTRRGYEYLGVKDDAKIPSDPKFRTGMAGSQQVLIDSPQTAWDAPYNETIHAMALLASGDTNKLSEKVRTVEASLERIALVTHQNGRAQREKINSAGGSRYVEHFNYLEGRSQPLFFKEDLEDEIDGLSEWNPFAPLNLALVKDPNGGENSFGSYLVYRKLEQQVRDFKERERKVESDPPSVSDELGLANRERQRVGAMVVGRFENGTPLAISKTDNLRSAPNNFNYDDDPKGTKCPHFAHIRKVNPRTEASKNHRIVRRGIPYTDVPLQMSPGDEHFNDDLNKMAEGEVGLLFMCFQASIENQFEHIQRLLNDPNEPTAGAGIDALIGHGDHTHAWPLTWGEDKTKTADFGNFVELKGGEYFFAPCISFFDTLV
jgi:Dyp-type peroxidase family